MIRRHFEKFRRDERGGAVPFLVATFLITLVAGGSAMDYMRYEQTRAALQDGVDRGLLSAANMRRTGDAESVLRGFLLSSIFYDEIDSDALDIQVRSINGLNYREAWADVSYTMDTVFLRYIGVTTLSVNTQGRAVQSRPNIEISLALDISGSMRFDDDGNGRRINFLRPAATEFVESLLDDDGAEYTSITIVPYAGMVNPGRDVFEILGATQEWPYNHCIELTSSDFSQTGFPTSGEQVPHFMMWDDAGWVDWGWCPTDTQADVWDTSDPNVTYICEEVVVNEEGTLARETWTEPEEGEVDAEGNPVEPELVLVDYTPTVPGEDEEDVQYIPCIDNRPVLTGAGGTSTIRNVDDTVIVPLSNDVRELTGLIAEMDLHDGTGTHNAMKWALAFLDPGSRDEVDELITRGIVPDEFSGRPANFNDDSTMKIIVLMTDGRITDQYRPVANRENDSRLLTNILNNRSSWRYTYSSRSTNINRFIGPSSSNRTEGICGLARDNGVIVYTIGFEVTNTVADEMTACASSPGHFFRAEGLEISDAFRSIFASIQKLKLIPFGDASFEVADGG
ncbi:MAG: pilus assembly protein TadG-related protein [Rubricella sp.]